MAVYKFSNVSGFKNYQKYNDFLAGNPAVVPDKGSMFPLGVFTLSADQATIEFTNIPQTFTHLQLRGILRTTRTNSSGQDYISMRFNSDSGSNYAYHLLYGIGSGTPTAQGSATQTQIFTGNAQRDGATASIFAGNVIDILDYRSVNKNKTVRTLGGSDTNGAGQITFSSGLWMNSSTAITSIRLAPESDNFKANSTIALYGVLA